MNVMNGGALGFAPDPEVRSKGLRIGCVGAGMIMAECHLAAYAEAGFPVVSIASRTRSLVGRVPVPGTASVRDPANPAMMRVTRSNYPDGGTPEDVLLQLPHLPQLPHLTDRHNRMSPPSAPGWKPHRRYGSPYRLRPHPLSVCRDPTTDSLGNVRTSTMGSWPPSIAPPNRRSPNLSFSGDSIPGSSCPTR